MAVETPAGRSSDGGDPYGTSLRVTADAQAAAAMAAGRLYMTPPAAVNVAVPTLGNEVVFAVSAEVLDVLFTGASPIDLRGQLSFPGRTAQVDFCLTPNDAARVVDITDFLVNNTAAV